MLLKLLSQEEFGSLTPSYRRFFQLKRELMSPCCHLRTNSLSHGCAKSLQTC